MKKNLILIDGMNMLYRCSFSMGLYHKSRRISEMMNFLSRLRTIKKQYPNSKIIVCGDSRSEKRKELFPEYKIKRNRDSKLYREMIQQAKDLEIGLDLLGIDFVRVKGLEADDLISTYSKLWKGDVIIYSTDSDLLQLIKKNVKVISNKKVINDDNFKEQLGIERKFFLLKKVIIGDMSDNIPGIRGIGKVKFKLLLEKSNYDMDTFLILPEIRQHLDIVERNFELMRLIVEDLDGYDEVMYSDKTLDSDNFREWLYSSGLFACLKHYISFITPFRSTRKKLSCFLEKV